MEPSYPQPVPSSEPVVSPADRSLGMWMHLGPLLAGVANMLIPIPFLPLVAAVILYYTQKDKSAFAAAHGKESLNFQITLMLIGIVLGIVFVAVFGASILGLAVSSGGQVSEGTAAAGVAGLIGGGLMFGGLALVLGIAVLVMMIIAAMRANGGQYYRYPFALRLIK